METQEFISERKQKARTLKRERNLSKKQIFIESALAWGFGLFAFLLTTREMVFDTVPLAFALLSCATRQTPFVFLGVLLGSFAGGTLAVEKLCGACLTVALRVLSSILLDEKKLIQDADNAFIEALETENHE